jgi:hypothetical protein
MMLYIVICMNDQAEYELATRTAWREREDALKYAQAIAASRVAIVVDCPRGIDFKIWQD